MELCYRGNRYQSNPSSLTLSKKRNPLKFRGCTYELNRLVINTQELSNSQVIYRGVSIANGQQIRFLGCSCEHKKVVLAPISV